MDEEAKKAASKGKGKSANTAAAAEDEEAGDDGVTVQMEGKTYKVKEDGTVEESEIEYPKGKVMRYVGTTKDDRVQFRDIKVSHLLLNLPSKVLTMALAHIGSSGRFV